jgi:sporulation protein YlmC with PRC-barrel domain
METIMKSALMAVVAVFLFAAAPARAEVDVVQADAWLIGMPIYTSDGANIGQITNIGSYKGENSLIGEVSSVLGFGSRRVLIPNSMATVQGDRIVLSIANDRVKDLVFPED